MKSRLISLPCAASSSVRMCRASAYSPPRRKQYSTAARHLSCTAEQALMQSSRRERSTDSCSVIATAPTAAASFEPWPWSGMGVQSSDDDADQSPNGRLRGQRAGGGQRVQAIGGEFVGRDVTAKLAGLGALGDELAYETMQLLLRARDVRARV